MEKLRAEILQVLDFYSIMLDQGPIADDILKAVSRYIESLKK